VSRIIALLPLATVENAAWSERMLLPRAFSRYLCYGPVERPPSVRMSSGLQPVEILSTGITSTSPGTSDPFR